MLVVLVAGIGDFVLATPALRALAVGFPDAEIALLTTTQAAELARPCPYLREVVPFDLRSYRPGERGLGWRGWRGFRRVTSELRTRRFSLAVDLYGVATWAGALRMALLLLRVGADRTAGRWSRGRGVIFDVRGPDRPHEMDAMLALAAALKCRSDDRAPELWIPEPSRQAAAACLSGAGIDPATPYAVLHPGSNKPEAGLPDDAAVEIGRRVRLATNYLVLLTGDRREARRTERLAAQIGGGAYSLAGRTDLLQLAAILEGAQAAVTTDSGPMHLAAAMGTPLVALFGPGDPSRFGPRGRGGQIAILRGVRYPRDPGRWHSDIGPEDVLDALGRCVRARRAPGAH